MLKVSRHIEETGNEIAALRLWDGIQRRAASPRPTRPPAPC
ncbi:MAG: hypothetical protein U0531_21170 [Dehalococcoidia bacterium]